jgi:hypothetical protein
MRLADRMTRSCDLSMRAYAFIPLLALTACGRGALPTRPSSAANPSPVVVSLEAEAGSGEGGPTLRAQASGGLTIHLAPEEQWRWTFSINAPQTHYAIAVTYSNDNIGSSEMLALYLDGIRVGAFEARDTGDNGDGWNIFVTDTAGDATISRGAHTLVIISSGGDGCVEIDKITLSP